MSTKFPNPSGKYAVGCVDVITSAGPSSNFFRLFYPTPDYEPTENKLAPWAEESEYIYGYSRFLDLSWIKLGFDHLIGNLRIPVLFQGPLDAENCQEMTFPLIVFSHGLGANRSSCCYICQEMASHGFIVASIEHKDLSASATYFMKKNDMNEALEKQWLYMTKIQKGDQGEQILRNMQVQKRAKECSKCLDHLQELNSGNLTNIVSDYDLQPFKGKINLEKVVMMGHSFGGATALLALKDDPRFKVGCMLDAWMEPIDVELCKPLYDVEIVQPMLFLNSETFQSAQTTFCLNKIKPSNANKKKVLKIFGTVHQTFSDFSLILPYYIAKAFQTIGSLDPVLASKIVTELLLKFVGNQFDLPCKGSIEEVVKEHDFVIDELANSGFNL